MQEDPHDHSKPVRYGNAFPWAGVLAGVKRMIIYSCLLVGLLILVGVIGVVILVLIADNEQVGNYF